jgi:hypothetical protein
MSRQNRTTFLPSGNFIILVGYRVNPNNARQARIDRASLQFREMAILGLQVGIHFFNHVIQKMKESSEICEAFSANWPHKIHIKRIKVTEYSWKSGDALRKKLYLFSNPLFVKIFQGRSASHSPIYKFGLMRGFFCSDSDSCQLIQSFFVRKNTLVCGLLHK